MDDTPLVAPQRTPIRCAIYTRQSVESHNDLSSCQVQFDLCSAHVRSLGYETVDERFDDEGHSGTTINRPALNRLLDVVRRGGVERVVVHRLDRLSRNLLHSTSLFNTFRHHNVKLDVVTAPELGAMAFDSFMLNMLASFAEFERDLTASRIAESRAHLKSHGRRVAGAVPYGYSADPRTKQLIVCDGEAQRVKQLFAWAASGLTPSRIAGDANGRGWTTKSGNAWTTRQVLATLKNHVYAGLIASGADLRTGCHEPLIEQATFDEVRIMIAARRTGKPAVRKKPLRLDWLLRGFLHCGTCGRLMSTHSVQVGPVMRCYYRCRSTAGGREACKGVMVSAPKIENLVLSKIGASPRLVTRERVALLQETVREIVYEATSGKVKITLLKPLDELVRDEAEAVDRSEAAVRRRSALRRH